MAVGKIIETSKLIIWIFYFFLIYKAGLTMLLLCVEILKVVCFCLFFNLVLFSPALSGPLKRYLLLLIYEIKDIFFIKRSGTNLLGTMPSFLLKPLSCPCYQKFKLKMVIYTFPPKKLRWKLASLEMVPNFFPKLQEAWKGRQMCNFSSQQSAVGLLIICLCKIPLR